MNQDNVKKLVEAAKEVVKQWDLQSGNDVIVLPIQELDNAINAIEHDGKVLCGSGWVAKDLKKYWFADSDGIAVYLEEENCEIGSWGDRNLSCCFTSWPEAVAESERRQGIAKLVNKDGNPPKVGEAVYLEVQDVKDAGKWVVKNKTYNSYANLSRVATNFDNAAIYTTNNAYIPNEYWEFIPLSEARRIEAERKAGK